MSAWQDLSRDPIGYLGELISATDPRLMQALAIVVAAPRTRARRRSTARKASGFSTTSTVSRHTTPSVPKYNPSRPGIPPSTRWVYQTDRQYSSGRRVVVDVAPPGPLRYVFTSNRRNSRPARCVKHFRFLTAGAMNCAECGKPVQEVEAENLRVIAAMRRKRKGEAKEQA